MKQVLENFLTVKQFTIIIENMVTEYRCTYMEALTKYSTDNNIEIETIGSLVKNSHILKAKLEAEVDELNMLKGSGAKLPI